MFTLDWCGAPMAEDPGEGGYKTGQVIKLDCGSYAIQPNNRMRWWEPSFVTKPFPERPDYKTNSYVWDCENKHKWATSDDDKFFYGVQSENKEHR